MTTYTEQGSRPSQTTIPSLTFSQPSQVGRDRSEMDCRIVFNIDIKYRSGKKIADADGLSRCQEEEQHVVFPEVLKAISVASQIVSEESPLFESVALSDTACSADTQEETL